MHGQWTTLSLDQPDNGLKSQICTRRCKRSRSSGDYPGVRMACEWWERLTQLLRSLGSIQWI